MSETTVTKEQRLAHLLRKTVADFAKAEVEAERRDIFADLMEKYNEDGIKQLVIKLPDGEPLATFTISQPKPKTSVADDGALIEWAQENRPELVEEVTAVRLRADAVKTLTAETTEVDGEHITDDGETVPGLRTTTAAPSSFTVKYSDGDESRRRLLEAWKSGELSALDTGETLPALDWAGQTEKGAA